MTPQTEAEVRLVVLGQIAIVRDRLAVLETALIPLPLGDQHLNERVTDAIGNLSIQTGGLIGVLHTYQGVASK